MMPLPRLSKRLVIVNGTLAVVIVMLGVWLVKDLTHTRPLPPPPGPRRAQAAAPVAAPTPLAAEDEKLATYNAIVAKHLFNPSRSEGGPTAATATAAPPPPKPMLLGVILDGPKSRAYLEDASTKRVFGYQVGDTVSGGRLDQITDDKVVIVRPDGAIDVLLRDPSKPKPAPTAATGAAGQPPGQPAPAAPSQPPTPAARAGNPAFPVQPPISPRAIRRLPVEPPQPQPLQPQPPQPETPQQ